MQIQSSIVVDETISQIYSKFKNELKIKQLSKLIPQYNTDYVSKIAGSAVITAFMKQPKLKSIFGYDQMHEDVFPKHIHIDQFANFQVKVNGDQIGGPIVRDKQPMASSKQTNRYRKTGSTFRNSSISKRKKQQEKQDLSKYFVVPPNNNNELYQLPFQPPTQQQIDLQYELRAMQKKLYFTRQQKKKEEQEQQERIKALKKRKSPEMPRTDFTYELNGNFMKRKPFKSDSLLVDEMKHCQSFDLKPKDKKSLNELLEEQEEVRGRSQLNSRYQRANLFNNSNKRQVSHLPFIKMSQNSKMREDNRNSEGNKTQRVSLKTFAESMEEKSFRHYSEIERQKKQRELLQKLQAQRIENMSEKMDKNPEQPQDSYNGNRRRQSYLMNKYLKKLKQQSVEQNRKSLNFNRVSFPRNTAIHNYYKHDFNEERRFYESEVISRVLDNSGNTTAR